MIKSMFARVNPWARRQQSLLERYLERERQEWMNITDRRRREPGKETAN